MVSHRADQHGHTRVHVHVHHFGCASVWRILLLAGLATLLLPALTGGPAPVAAQDRSVEWTRFDVSLDLRTDGSFHVEERQEIAFSGGPFTFGFANIPLDHLDEIGGIKVSEVTGSETTPLTFVPRSDYDEDAGTYTYRITSTEAQIQWAFAPTTDASRTFVLAYDVVGGLRVYLENDPPNQQIWWVAVGPEVTEVAPVREATMTIRMPIPIPVDHEAVVTSDGEPEEHTEDGQVWTWAATDLEEGDSFEARLQFPALIPVGPPAWQEADDERRRNEEEREERGAFLDVVFIGLGLLLAVGGGLGTYGLWYSRGRDPHTGPVADFLPTPPDDLPAGAAGTLLDERAHHHDIVATLVDLGHLGVIKIDETEDDGVPGIGGSRDFNLTLLKGKPAVAPFEEELLQALFGFDLKEGATARLSQVKERFDAVLPAIREDLYAEVVRRGYFARSPEATRDSWRNFGTIAIAVAIIAGCVGAGAVADLAGFVWFPVVVVIGLAVVLIVLSGSMPRKTEAGAEAAAKWRAFRKYLDDIEKYEKLDEAQDVFDRYLPYAIAFGLERSWVQKFAAVRTPTPAWYGGGAAGGGTWFDTFDPDPYPRRRRGGRGGTVLLPGGGWSLDRPSGGGGGGGGDFDLPDLQGTSDRAGRSLQSSSDGFFSMLNLAAQAFSSFAGSSKRGGGGWGGGGGFGGGGSRGGGGGGGSRGFG